MEIPVEGIMKKAGKRIKDISEIFYPAMDISEDGEMLHIYLDLPGFKKDDVRILSAKGGLRVSGKREKEYSGTMIYEERVTEFSKFVRIAGEFDPDSVTAKMQEGILEIVVTRKEIKTINIA
ncbi:MAG: Hsp20/alpha crystallin family protein [Candidatus Thermoplasmatota archaeon]|jgi:HSP20 family protein|nr:Hsp20/alpha crystallin family protein [Candidatus Thermoplasmatota archaeon]MCL5680439.1 Hsp20/alpha crystallin family protein [Candidatus Thermoplasmatota archaeon]